MSARGLMRGVLGAALVLGCVWSAGDGPRAAHAAGMSPLASAAGAATLPAIMAATAAASPAPANEGQDIRDIHGPIALPGRLRLAWAAAGALAVIGLAGGILYRNRRRPPLPPHQRALRALDQARALLGGDPRVFSFKVSEIVRSYVEEVFPLRAAHRTTEELLEDLMRDQSPVASQRAELAVFLRHCDLAKFAGWSLSPADMAAMLASAAAFVRATAPDSARPPAPITPGKEGVALA